MVGESLDKAIFYPFLKTNPNNSGSRNGRGKETKLPNPQMNGQVPSDPGLEGPILSDTQAYWYPNSKTTFCGVISGVGL